MPQTILHPLEPIWDSHSRILILGTMPSPRSRELGYYYAHPQNRFWKILGCLFKEEVPEEREARLAFARSHGIALWDVLKSCEIEGASDSSIRSPIPNDIRPILENAPIQAIFTTGTTAYRLYQRYIHPVCCRDAMALPSTSAANCRQSLPDLVQAYQTILPFLGL
ncbi:MAG: DNA-deoxyinosine glycosylase [Candidatus Merdivicinus sp.]|jgi:TDG/mug DNA glycosylase family protein